MLEYLGPITLFGKILVRSEQRERQVDGGNKERTRTRSVCRGWLTLMTSIKEEVWLVCRRAGIGLGESALWSLQLIKSLLRPTVQQ